MQLNRTCHINIGAFSNNLTIITIVLSVFSLADCTLEKQLSTQENWI